MEIESCKYERQDIHPPFKFMHQKCLKLLKAYYVENTMKQNII